MEPTYMLYHTLTIIIQVVWKCFTHNRKFYDKNVD